MAQIPLKTRPPKISVVCPTYNVERYILATLNSVFKQTTPPYELITSDDGSTDKTVSLIEDYIETHSSFPVILLRNVHAGPGAARNRGVEKAEGDWIAFLDADDLWENEKLETVSEFIMKHPDKNVFCHNEIYTRLNGSKEILEYGLFYDEKQPLPRQIFLRNFFSTSTVVCRKSIVEKAGFFDENLPSAQDYELWLRMSPYIKPFFIERNLGYFVEREGSISSLTYWRKYRHLLKIAFRHRDKATVVDLIKRVMRVTLSKSWFHSLSNYFSGKAAHN